MSKALCTICHFLYDSRVGFPDLDIGIGTSFSDVDDATFSCPQCGSSKDQFVEVVEQVVEVADPEDLTEIEAEHVPHFRSEDDVVVVEIGIPGYEHPQEAEHRIEWIEALDADGEVLEHASFNPGEAPIARFPIDLEDIGEIHASCSEHGIWKAISHESLGT